jgi:hypothetical protein
MENNVLKLFSTTLIIYVVASFILSPLEALAFSPYDTHQDLTEQIAKLYNNTNSGLGPEISGQQIIWMRQAVIDEDKPPRWMNHFYNPQTGTGWTGKHFSNWATSTTQALFGSMLPYLALPSVNWVRNQPV